MKLDPGETALRKLEKSLFEQARPDPLPVRNWRRRAACRTADPELFFQLSENSPLTEQAKTYCRECPVTGKCLAFAVLNGCWGVWGGVYRPEPSSAAGQRARDAARQAVPAP